MVPEELYWTGSISVRPKDIHSEHCTCSSHRLSENNMQQILECMYEVTKQVLRRCKDEISI